MVIGCDPSLTGCGVSDGARHIVISTKSDRTLADRSAQIMRGIREFVGPPPESIRVHSVDMLGVVNTDPIDDKGLHLFVEAPAPGIAAGSSNPYDRGWLDCDLHRLAKFLGASIVMVSTGTLRKFITGKGNTAKEELGKICLKKWGIDIENDRGFNKLEAYCLVRYGQAVLAGEIEHVEIAKRGAGRRKKTVA